MREDTRISSNFIYPTFCMNHDAGIERDLFVQSIIGISVIFIAILRLLSIVLAAYECVQLLITLLLLSMTILLNLK